MGEYNGPSFMKHAKHHSSHTSTNRLKSNLENKNEHKSENDEQQIFNEDRTHSLPNQIRSRAEVEKGFQEYLHDKKITDTPNRTKHYIEPPFEVSRVPSPIYGFKKPVKKSVETWDYTALTEALKKEPFDFILFEEYVTEEITSFWDKQEHHSKETGSPDKKEFTQTFKTENKQDEKKRMRLHRSLMNIIQEEQLGANASKRNIPGFFSDENE
ncbi:hypothetical protein [Marinilactibacillus kalidii]|uniref:hypothetical protein n=1 Tax=Marinilactibacillus kalidii TaxID=2820274 RepID=UPI001ABE377D|nr:hypothetical protein [Marinilactibacillus kalidii]